PSSRRSRTRGSPARTSSSWRRTTSPRRTANRTRAAAARRSSGCSSRIPELRPRRPSRTPPAEPAPACPTAPDPGTATTRPDPQEDPHDTSPHPTPPRPVPRRRSGRARGLRPQRLRRRRRPRRTDSVRIILGHGAAPGNPRSEGALAFQRLVAEKSDGEVEVQILGQESVGSDSEMMVSVASGTLDMSINSQGPFSSYVPEASLIGLPFLFENAQHASQVLDGEVQQSIAALSEEKGFHVLGFWDNGM